MVSRTKKFRGSRTHGRGRKAGRGAGLRGGRGNAGLHKHRFKYMLKYFPDHFGDRGFKRPLKMREEKNCINLMELEEALPRLQKDGIAITENDTVIVNLDKIGVDKLLSNGKVNTKLKLEVKEASRRAQEKVEASGGSITFIEQSFDEQNKKSEGMDA
jgi:large subunit ribosomal protein L15